MADILLLVFLGLLVLAIPFCIYMDRKAEKRFFEEHGRHSNIDDYLDHPMRP